MELTAVILAAGEAKRMRSRQPKVLTPVCGRPVIAYALRTTRAVADRTVVVIGPNAAAVRAAADAGVTFVEQRERLGTGHALEQARAACGDGPVVVLAGDMPLLSSETLERLVSHHRTTSAAATVLTAVVRSEEHTSELQSPCNLVCRLLLEKKKKIKLITFSECHY